ncbi:MAG: pentapeptide repeat-containing protein [Holophagaceae bacterium]|nr:pentapeptide repeat-containing protein [Holophagaceae bacterium]
MSDLTRDDFLQALKDKKRTFEHMDFENMDLRGIDLQGINFTGSNLSFVKLTGNRLTEANLSRADLSEAELDGCKLMGANLEGAILRKADLTEANLTGARLQRTDLRGADLSRAICAEADLRGADLTRAKLSVVDFRLANLGRANLTGAMLRGALMRGADLREAILEGATGIEQEVSTSQTVEAPMLKPGTMSTNIPPSNIPPSASPARTQAMAPGRTQTMAPGSTQAMAAAGILVRPAGRPAPPKSAPKAKKYHPPLRQIPALIFTSSGWIRGQFHLPVMHGFLDFLNRMGDLLKLTDVTLPHLKRELTFFGLRRDSAIMIIPDCEESLLSLPTITGNAETHQTSFLMATGSVTGNMTIEADIRVSDYLNQGRWVVLRDCEVGSHAGPGGRSKVAAFPLLVLNTSCVIGTSDESLVNYE